MLKDLFTVFSWWFLLFGLGIICLPITRFLFRRFFDFGYAFSKIIAILLISYLIWLAGSLKILPFSLFSIWLIIIILVFFNFFLARKYRKEFFKQIKKSWKIIVFEEILFFLALTFWSFIRGFQPDIEGLEKFMDFGFVNSILHSRYFPPQDMWMAGKTINYYYFGHLVAAVLTKISGIDSAITYNLMIATIFALTFTAAFSLGGNLIFTAIRNTQYAIRTGLLSAFLLTLGGNLQILWYFFTHHFSFSGYWYPDATRFIVEKFGALDNTIHEFPIYSFVVSDLHGHFSDIPFVLLFLGLLFSFITSFKTKRNYALCTMHFALLLALTLAVMYMTNSWDFPIYFLILGATICYFNYLKYGFSFKSFLNICLPARRSLGAGGLVVFVLICSILFSLPFHLNFSQIAQGIGFVHARSPFWQLLVLWGYQWILAAGFLIYLGAKKLQITNYKLQIPDVFILILISIATLLIIIPEFFYVKDIYISSYHRANTMFKLVYQSFMLYALVSGYIIVRISASLRQNIFKFLYVILILSLSIFIFLYPYFAINSYYQNLKVYQGLYGLSFLKRGSIEDYEGVLWLKKNILGQPVVLEAAGDSYTDFNRVSSLTGLPTIQGWLVHEWLWRGSLDEPGKRATEVQTIYETKNKEQASDLMRKYKVQYVFMGAKEREKYQLSEEKFNLLGKIVFQSQETKIYKIDSTN